MSSSHQLAVSEHVPADATPATPLLVLVHGSLDRSGSFTRVLRRLPDVHTVIYDRRGYHRSRHALPINTTVDGHVDDLLAVIDERPCVVVGHSYGGDIALGAALRGGGSPWIRAVAAYEPPLPWLGTWSRRPRAADRPLVSADPDDGDAAGDAAEQFFRRMVGDAAWDRLPEAGKADRRADGPALAAELDAIRLTEAPFDVSTLTIPAVFGRGGNSLPHHRQAVAWLVEHTPGSELVEIPGAQHGAHLTHPDAFADMARLAIARSDLVAAPAPVPSESSDHPSGTSGSSPSGDGTGHIVGSSS
jgi:pimeloyl-ACP methyl ester carboxylesterase